jgi:hypothetical protein
MRLGISLGGAWLPFLIVLGIHTPAFGGEPIALVTSLKGKAVVQRAAQQAQQSVHVGEKLFEADVLCTQEESRVSLLLADGSVISVHPKSRLTLSLRKVDPKGGSRVVSLSKGVVKGMGRVFSPEEKRETLTAVPGIRKKIEAEEVGIKVLFPRNSMILTPRPDVRWAVGGGGRTFMVSLTLKGMGGDLWTIRTQETGIPYPKDAEGLEPGQTYFLKVESTEDASLWDEVYFRVLGERDVDDVRRLTQEMEALQSLNPDDTTPRFILVRSYMSKGLYHLALDELDAWEAMEPGERLVLEEKREILAKIGLWKQWEEVNQKLGGATPSP